ncbi:MAG: hypothetical protein WAO21_12645 [Verrucomicrobiia bacterium]
MGDIVKFFVADIFELLAARLELFVDFDGLFGHHRVRFLGAANKREIWPGGEPSMTIGVQPDTKQYRFAFLFTTGVRHEFRLNAVHHPVKSQTLAQTRRRFFSGGAPSF